MKFPPRDFFLNVAAMAALYVSVVSLVVLLFQYINYLFPDLVSSYDYYDPYSGTIRFAIASLIIVFPLYIFFTRLVHQDLRRDPLKREGMFRRWLIYVTLFVAGATIAGDLITLINTYLSGEISTRFGLKVLTVLIIAAAVFLYYWHELKGTWEVREGQSKLVGVLVTLMVIGSVISGFFIIGSPAHQRDMRFDQQRVSDLQMLQSGVVSYWQAKRALPTSIEDLNDPIMGFRVPSDPESGEAYSYRATDSLTFEVCAIFATASEVMDGRSVALYDPYGQMVNWEHGVGQVCFERTIDPERLPELMVKPIF